ncbi:Fanconi-associated nuclease 1 homolog [Undibacterium sp. KW1]|uniref:VRR-NUC domain-containing protein n=1 Tax=Undibacterium sp. KW1 TaxID=2058624 RepID=UPI001331F34C|nr:VRR-NUC domain-containing protein [Undibacterium sp. KW1]BBB59680.1 Fanconi-associated nuclease 1 homolog [Undibacterium sp. KW1]
MLANLDNPFYYLENFQAVLGWVGGRYADLLADDEQAFIAQFGKLPQASRALFVRMVMRKGCVFRASKLVYGEIGDTCAAMQALVDVGWVQADPVLDIAGLFDLLQKPELALVLAMTPAEKKLSKAEQLGLFSLRHTGSQAFSAWCAGAMGAVDDVAYQVLNKDLCDRLRLLFFGNLYQDWSEFVLSDLGIFQYEKVEFSAASRGFGCRADIDAYLALHACREAFHAEQPVPEVLAQLAATGLHAVDNAWIASRRNRLLYQIGEYLEKQKDWALAQQVYAGCTYPGARLRAIRVLEKSEQTQAAYDLLTLAQQAPESEAEHQQMLRIAPRLARKLGLAKAAKAPSKPPTELALRLPFPQEDYVVEYVVRDHLHTDDAPVFYVENALINSLFGLLCWPVIFKAIPGAFFHPFQRGPTDLLSVDFQARRADDFATCFAQLDTGAYRQTIRQTYATKSGLQSPFVFWSVLSEDLLEMALECIPAQHLKHSFERILLDIRANRNGFPDLIQFWPQERRYQMIEVKGPGDKLQDNQKRWLDFCATHDMPVTVCYLEWLETEP